MLSAMPMSLVATACQVNGDERVWQERVAPVRLPVVGVELDRTAHAVGDRLPVFVGMVHNDSAVIVVLDERDRAALVPPPRCPRQGEPVCGQFHGHTQTLSPDIRSACVVDLIEDRQRRAPGDTPDELGAAA